MKSVADFVFKAIKVVSTPELEDGFQTTTEAIIGLYQTIVLKRVHFLLNSPEIQVLPGDSQSKDEVSKKRHICDQYMAYNMKEVTI